MKREPSLIPPLDFEAIELYFLERDPFLFLGLEIEKQRLRHEKTYTLRSRTREEHPMDPFQLSIPGL